MHIPVVLYSATAETRPKFNLIDPNSMSPVGNKQVSKTTGEAVAREELVKGIQVEEGQYVVLSKEEIRNALPRTTQTIEIEAFVDGLQYFSLAESLGGVESLIAHPASMTHSAMAVEARRAAGIDDSLLRLSVGIEDGDDLLRDLDAALLRAVAVDKSKRRVIA